MVEHTVPFRPRKIVMGTVGYGDVYLQWGKRSWFDQKKGQVKKKKKNQLQAAKDRTLRKQLAL